MRRGALVRLTAAATLAALFAAPAAAAWRLDRVVVVMRHGVRPPTKPPSAPPGATVEAWPGWDVNWGELTHHGEHAIALLGAFDRHSYAGLLGAGCPQVHGVADVDQRTVRTAEVYLAALLPGCAVTVEHGVADGSDARFAPFDDRHPLSDDQVSGAARAALPPGGTAALDRALAPDWAALDHILACRAAPCIAARPTTVSVAGGRVKLDGAVAQGGSLAETLALEYADGKPLAQVGWGRASRKQISRLLELHSWEFALTARPPAIARAGSAALLGDVAAALTQPTAPRFSLFVGHDGNLALVGGALGLHWKVPQFARDDPPPGGALIFERWRSDSGRYRLVVRFRSQTLDEMRDLAPLGLAATQPLSGTACGGGDGCDAAGLRAALTPR